MAQQIIFRQEGTIFVTQTISLAYDLSNDGSCKSDIFKDFWIRHYCASILK